MSIPTYRHKERRGLVGAHRPVCWPAAVEQVVPEAVRLRSYDHYESFVRSDVWRGSERNFWATSEQAYDEVFRSIGGLSCSDVDFRRVNTWPGFRNSISELVHAECGVVIDLRGRGGSIHSVGLLPEDEDLFQLVSTFIPVKLEGDVPLGKLYDRLVFPDEVYSRRYPFKNANITALPPAA